MRNDIEWWGIKGKVNEEMVACVEIILDIKFPGHYLECVRKYPHGTPSPSGFRTKKSTTHLGEWGGEFGYLFDFNPESVSFILKKYHSLNYHSKNANELPDRVIPFASADGNDDYLCFDYREGYPPKVILFEVEKHWEYLDRMESGIKMEEDDYLIPVSNSFKELLEMLEEVPKDD